MKENKAIKAKETRKEDQGLKGTPENNKRGKSFKRSTTWCLRKQRVMINMYKKQRKEEMNGFKGIGARLGVGLELLLGDAGERLLDRSLALGEDVRVQIGNGNLVCYVN